MNRKIQGYLFVHFTGETEEGEQIYFSLSRDGMHWQDLKKGKPVLSSSLGEKGVRDPFILRSVCDNKFYIIATDLRIADGKGWEAARSEGSRKIILWNSEDLIHWSRPWAYEIPRSDFGCVWAPEAIFDIKRQAYLVFWASLTRENEELKPKHRIFCSYTKDFHSFTPPAKYMERENHIIDTTIVEDDGIYYRFSKEAATENIRIDCGCDLQGEFKEIVSVSLEKITGVEGPAAFYLPEKKAWCLMIDQFAKRLGYLPLLCHNLADGEFQLLSQNEYDMGKSIKRHGSVLGITLEEYDNLKKMFGHQTWT